MKSIRLNTEMRKAILENIKQAYIKANPQPVMTVNTTATLEKAVRTHYMKQSLELRKLVEEHPELQGAMRTTNRIRYKTPTGGWGDIYAEEGERFLEKYAETTRDFSSELYLSKHPALKKAAEEFNVLKKVVRKEREAFDVWARELEKYLDEIRQVLLGVNTTKQLVEQWEEVKEYIPACYANPSKIALPAISTAALNAKLGK